MTTPEPNEADRLTDLIDAADSLKRACENMRHVHGGGCDYLWTNLSNAMGRYTAAKSLYDLARFPLKPAPAVEDADKFNSNPHDFPGQFKKVESGAGFDKFEKVEEPANLERCDIAPPHDKSHLPAMDVDTTKPEFSVSPGDEPMSAKTLMALAEAAKCASEQSAPAAGADALEVVRKIRDQILDPDKDYDYPFKICLLDAEHLVTDFADRRNAELKAEADRLASIYQKEYQYPISVMASDLAAWKARAEAAEACNANLQRLITPDK